MTNPTAIQEAREVTLHATVIRADGTREELGELAHWNKSAVRRAVHRIRHGKTGKIQVNQ